MVNELSFMCDQVEATSIPGALFVPDSPVNHVTVLNM